MIAFKKGENPSPFTRSDLDEMLDEILANKSKLSEATTIGGLHPLEIQDVIAFLMFEETNSSVQFTVSKEPDDYHLSLVIDKKQKNP